MLHAGETWHELWKGKCDKEDSKEQSDNDNVERNIDLAETQYPPNRKKRTSWVSKQCPWLRRLRKEGVGCSPTGLDSLGNGDLRNPPSPPITTTPVVCDTSHQKPVVHTRHRPTRATAAKAKALLLKKAKKGTHKYKSEKGGETEKNLLLFTLSVVESLACAVAAAGPDPVWAELAWFWPDPPPELPPEDILKAYQKKKKGTNERKIRVWNHNGCTTTPGATIFTENWEKMSRVFSAGCHLLLPSDHQLGWFFILAWTNFFTSANLSDKCVEGCAYN